VTVSGALTYTLRAAAPSPGQLVAAPGSRATGFKDAAGEWADWAGVLERDLVGRVRGPRATSSRGARRRRLGAVLAARARGACAKRQAVDITADSVIAISRPVTAQPAPEAQAAKVALGARQRTGHAREQDAVPTQRR